MAQKSKKTKLTEEQIAALPHTMLSLGHGVGAFANSVYDSIVDWERKETEATLGPYFIKCERMFKNNLAFGINIAYFQLQQSGRLAAFNDSNEQVRGQYTYNTFSVLLRANYHINYFGKFVPYLGLGLGYRYGAVLFTDNWAQTNDYTYANNPHFPTGFEATFGFRYFITPQWALYAEAGLAKSILQGGASYRFKNKLAP